MPRKKQVPPPFKRGDRVRSLRNGRHGTVRMVFEVEANGDHLVFVLFDGGDRMPDLEWASRLRRL